MTKHDFYDNTAVFVEDLDYTVNDAAEPLQQMIPSALIQRTVAAVVMGASLVFGPINESWQGTNGNARVVMHAEAPAPAGVAISAAQVQVAKRFNQMFRSVPLHPVEALPDPDFDL